MFTWIVVGEILHQFGFVPIEAETLDTRIFFTTYKITGLLCILGFIILLRKIIKKPTTKNNLIYYGVWIYVLLITGIEGITDITANTFGH